MHERFIEIWSSISKSTVAHYNGEQAHLEKFATEIVEECTKYIQEKYPNAWYEAEFMKRHFNKNNE